MSKYTVFCIILGAIFTVEAYKRYDNYKVLQIIPQNHDQLAAVQSLQEQTRRGGVFRSLDFWHSPSTVNAPVDIMVQPKDLPILQKYLSQRNIQAKIIIQDVQKLIDQDGYSDKRARKPFRHGDSPNDFAIDQYHSLQEIYDWIDSLVAAYPNLISAVNIGQSFEKRDMKLAKIGTKGTNKASYFVDAGFHAREWISVSTAVFIINELVTKYDTNATYKDLVDKIDFYILTAANPDGYEYTRSTDRMWRKTRSGPYGTSKSMGVDPNRNFDFHWMESGASQVPVSEEYAGPYPFSEIECVNIADFLGSHNDTLKAYITLHSYSDLFMYPYGYAPETFPPDVQDLKNVAISGVAAIKAVHGTVYEYGTKPEVLYADSGTSDDWAKGVANIKYSYALELRPGTGDPDPDQGYGFCLPPEYIIRVGEETWAGMQEVAKAIIN